MQRRLCQARPFQIRRSPRRAHVTFPHVSDALGVYELWRAVRLEGVAEPLHEMSEAAVSALRSGSGWEEAEEGRPEGAGEIALAISGGVAVADGCRAGDVR